MLKQILKSCLYISLLLPLATCKKYRQTLVIGRFVNIPINKGIPNETFVLKTYTQGGFLLPDKANIEMTTQTDENGYFQFSFEAYTPHNERKQPGYGVEWINLNKKKLMVQFSDHSLDRKFVDLSKEFNDDLLAFQNIGSLGKRNYININVVFGGNLKVFLKNEIAPISPNDTIHINFINQFGEFNFGGFIGEGSILLNDGKSNYYPGLVPGETTIRATITKNGITEIRDTTFFVEDKEYYLEYRY